MKIGVIDTHILVWYFEGGKKLSTTEINFIDDEKNRLVIPSIVLCETKYLVYKGRLKVDFDAILRHIVGDPRIEIFPLDIDVASRLPQGLEMHDGIIVATALLCQKDNKNSVSLLTHDAEIKSSGLVRVLE